MLLCWIAAARVLPSIVPAGIEIFGFAGETGAAFEPSIVPAGIETATNIIRVLEIQISIVPAGIVTRFCECLYVYRLPIVPGIETGEHPELIPHPALQSYLLELKPVTVWVSKPIGQPSIVPAGLKRDHGFPSMVITLQSYLLN